MWYTTFCGVLPEAAVNVGSPASRSVFRLVL